MTRAISNKTTPDRFFAKVASGGLILRLIGLLTVLTLSLIVSVAASVAVGSVVQWADLAIAFVLLAIAFSVALGIEGIPIDPQLVLARLSATTVARLGIPLAGIVLLDRVLRPGFLANTLIFWLIGFSVGLLVSSLISLGRLSHEP